MPIDQPQNNTVVPTRSVAFSAWLAANKKMAILGAVAVVLIIAASLVWWQRGSKQTVVKNSTNANTNSVVSSNTNTTDNRTFERFNAVVNRPEPSSVTSLPRPTRADTAQALKNLNTNAQ